jgi:hypothetical protein
MWKALSGLLGRFSIADRRLSASTAYIRLLLLKCAAEYSIPAIPARKHRHPHRSECPPTVSVCRQATVTELIPEPRAVQSVKCGARVSIESRVFLMGTYYLNPDGDQPAPDPHAFDYDTNCSNCQALIKRNTMDSGSSATFSICCVSRDSFGEYTPTVLLPLKGK